MDRVDQLLGEMSDLLRMQDNRCTHLPIYVVQTKVREYGFDPDYAEDTAVWLHCDGSEADSEEAAELDAKYEAGEDEPDDWTRTSYQDRWEFVQPFFTEKAANEYIERMRHRHRGELRVYVESAYRNPEWEFVRELIMRLGAGPSRRRFRERSRAWFVRSAARLEAA